MRDDDKIVSLEDMDTAILSLEGWELKKVFEGAPKHTVEIFETAMEYAEKLAECYTVGYRPVKSNKSVFVDIYVNKK